jgi:hypothetical protein
LRASIEAFWHRELARLKCDLPKCLLDATGGWTTQFRAGAFDVTSAPAFMKPVAATSTAADGTTTKLNHFTSINRVHQTERQISVALKFLF